MQFDTRQVIYGIDLLGTASFAFSGAIRAIDRRPDFVGMLILAGATAVGGSVLRDVILSRGVVFLHDWHYPLVILFSVVATCLFPTALCKQEHCFMYFDALGLGAFSAITASAAWESPGMNPLSVLFVATFTSCAGSVIRDLLIQKPSLVLANELYVTPVVIGAAALMVVRTMGFDQQVGLVAAALVATSIRIVAIHWNWRLPRIRHAPYRQGRAAGSE